MGMRICLQALLLATTLHMAPAGAEPAVPVAAMKNPGACGIEPAAAGARPIRIQAVGDIVLGNSFVVDDIPAHWEGKYFAGVRSVLKQSDLLLGNIEGAITTAQTTQKQMGSGRQFAFRFPVSYAGLLRSEGFTHLNVANNHAFDFGEAGYSEMLGLLRQAQIVPVGERQRFEVTEIRGLKVALIGFMYAASFNSVYDIEGGEKLVREAKAKSDFVIVTFHAGAEGTLAASHGNEDEVFLGEHRGNVVAFARAMARAGAGLIVGHGPHVLRSVECVGNVPVIYSLGNFVGVGGLSNRNLASASVILQADVTPAGKISDLRFVPVRLNEEKVPVPDAEFFGVQLINTLGRQARYEGKFGEFAVPAGNDKSFEGWYRESLARARAEAARKGP